MLAALIALLLGGAAFALGGGGGGSTASAAPMSARTDEDDEPAGDDTPESTPLSPEDTPDIQDSAYSLDWGGLSAEEQLIVELVNRARLDPRGEEDRLNEPIDSGANTSPQEALAVVSTLSEAARAHSQDMDDRNFFDHQNPDGQSPGDRALEEGHPNSYVGENIAVIGSSWTNFDEQARAEDLHFGLWESNGHQVNMLRSQWSEIGVGYDYGTWSGYEGSTFVTEKFSDTGQTYLTGVVIEDADNDDFYDMGEGQGGVRITAIDEADESKVYTTSTWDAGGYTLALPSGTYRVIFEGGDLDVPQEATVTIGDENVKLDIIDEGAGGAVFASATLSADPAAGAEPEADAMLPSLPPVEEGEMIALDEDDLELEAVLL